MPENRPMFMPSETRTGPDRCYWYRDDDGEILIPMCWGTAINGLHECTCDVPVSRIEAAERGRAEAERQIMKMREAHDRRMEIQQSDWRRMRRLRARIDELERELAALSAASI